jgi:3-hydroxyisobutyrate dehydrogenase-like beta-hydroxyacid dehydrogenase
MEIGFIGLGRMGIAMATNLIKAGHRVQAWNRSGPPKDAIGGLAMVASPDDAFQADAVFTMLSDDPAIREVLLVPGVLRRARPGVVHVVTSTISVAFADELRAEHEEAGIGYVSAPVFGRPDVAEKAELKIMAAGADIAVAKILPLLDVIGNKTWVLGPDPKQANAAKIAGNMMIAMAIEAMAEAAVISGSNGLSPETFFNLMLETQFSGSRAYANYSAKILASDYEAGFLARLGLKDLGLAVAAGKASGRTLPQLQAVHRRMTEAVEAGMGDQDWSAMAGYTLHGGKTAR